MSNILHIITPEYPPDTGGVSDYTALVAHGLRDAGYTVHVWCPESRRKLSRPDNWVHRQIDGLGLKGLRQLGAQLDAFPKPRRILVQWVPHGYGLNAMNVFFCLWLWLRAICADEIQIMLHEPFLSFWEGSWRRNVAAAVQRVMTCFLLRSTRRLWMSTPSWESMLRPYALGRRIEFEWLPVPSNIAVAGTPAEVVALRRQYAADDTQFIGHFGTYGNLTTDLLDQILPAVLAEDRSRVLLLIGANGEEYRERFLETHPQLAARVVATGLLDEQDISRHLLACDVLVQLYPEGLTTRRTTCLAALAHGIPVVTNRGRLTETVWLNQPSAVMLSTGCRDAIEGINGLLADREAREKLSAAAKGCYKRHFALEHLIRHLCAALPEAR
jgi:glycosyltransferase involved in cell wall biosynthesis